MITFVFNPISIVARAADIAFPGIQAEVQFVPQMETRSHIDFYVGSEVSMVDINANLSLEDILDEMLDVFAMLGSGSDGKTGEKYEAARRKVQKELERLMEESLSKFKNE